MSNQFEKLDKRKLSSDIEKYIMQNNTEIIKEKKISWVIFTIPFFSNSEMNPVNF